MEQKSVLICRSAYNMLHRLNESLQEDPADMTKEEEEGWRALRMHVQKAMLISKNMLPSLDSIERLEL